MKKITQFSAAAMLVAFASTVFVSTAEAGSRKVWCEKASSKLFRTACEEIQRRSIKRYVPPTYSKPRTVKLYNFRGRTDAELGLLSRNGGNGSTNGNGTAGGNSGSGGTGGQGGKR